MKHIYKLFILVLFFFLTSCNINMGSSTPSISVEQENIELELNDTYNLVINFKNVEEENQQLTFEYDSNIISIDKNNKIKALKPGTTSVRISLTNVEAETIVLNVTVLAPKPGITVTNEIKDKYYVGDTFVLEFNLDNASVFDLLIEVADHDILSIGDDYVVKFLKAGTTTISFKFPNFKVEPFVLTLSCIEPPVINDEITGLSNLIVGETGTYKLGDYTNVEFYTDDTDLIQINGNSIKALKEGCAILKVNYLHNYKEFTINITKDNIKPTISYTGLSRLTLNWNSDYNIYEDLVVTDNIDLDIKERVTLLEDFDFKDYGLHTITYVVTDSSGNSSQVTREIEIIWNYDVSFIGHGGSYYGAMNSEEAILYAAEVLKYQAIEVDLSQTSDGVFVLCHDATFGDYTVAITPWATLKDYEITVKRSAGYPAQNGSVTNSPYTATLCTLDRYLEICKEYGIKAVIELKSSKGISNTDQSRMPALMNVIEKHDMLEDVIFLASAYNTLIWTRNNGYSDIECQYLVGSCESAEVLNRCITYNLHISINTTYGDYSNSDEWLARYKEAGLKISTYTYTQYTNYDVVQKWIDKGVDYVTCDWHRMDRLNLPTKSSGNIENYTVKFYNHDGELIKETKVFEGNAAAAPFLDERVGYRFTGWNYPITNITCDLEVYPVYELLGYNITYLENLDIATESNWTSKEEFKNEFYSDFFNWLVANIDNIDELTLSGDTYTLSLNDSTATFKNASDIMAVNIYIFEKTFSNFIYKPVTRNSDGTCLILEDENYFLNSGNYRIKYQGVDQWLLNAINVGYPSYSNTYKPLSSGKIQIFFRMHQWFQGTPINCFDNLPKKYIVEKNNYDVTMPTTYLFYTILDEFTLPIPTGELTFLGWYDNKECSGSSITKIEVGTTGDLVLYAKWNLE